MNLELKGRIFIVGGVTSGFGKAIAEQLMNEGAKVIGLARGAEKLALLHDQYPDNLIGISADITKAETLKTLDEVVNVCDLSGIVINAAGPPATTAMETTLEQWDSAYDQVLRWKIQLMQHFLPHMMKVGYGRVLFVESYSVKQPVPNLVLSNSLRMAVVGYVKTLAREIAESGVTLNVLAPGFHSTPAAQRLVAKSSQERGISAEVAEKDIVSTIPMGHMGDPTDFASLASWLLSPNSRYLTGQTISVDGGAVNGVFG